MAPRLWVRIVRNHKVTRGQEDLTRVGPRGERELLQRGEARRGGRLGRACVCRQLQAFPVVTYGGGSTGNEGALGGGVRRHLRTLCRVLVWIG